VSDSLKKPLQGLEKHQDKIHCSKRTEQSKNSSVFSLKKVPITGKEN
jgi:hypothetical protein